MKTPIDYIKTVTAVLVLLAACCISPAAADGTDRAMVIFDLINQCRAVPYDYAVSLGYDPADLQEKGIGPETVFAPYVLDETLSAAAAAANARESAAATESEPMPPVHRHTAQTSSVFSFSHFMSIETAGQIFVENLFKDEVETGDFQFILSEVFGYAGTSAEPGVVIDTQMNAWFLSLALGSFEQVTEMQMLNLINQVRANPPLTQFFIQTDSTLLFEQNPQLYELPKMQFGPVFQDDMLQHWAWADVAMSGEFEGDYPFPDDNGSGVDGEALPFNAALPQTAEPDQDTSVLADFQDSYPGEFFQTATVAASWEDMTTAQPVSDLFSALLFSELATWPYGAMVFSNLYTQAGVAISLETLENTGTGIVSVYAGSFIAQSQVPEETDVQVDPQLVPDETDAGDLLPDDTESSQVRIYGVLFSDHDDDLMYSPGEEVGQHTVSVYELAQDPVSVPDENHTLVKTVVTDNAGHFSLYLDPGRQWVFEAEKDGLTARQEIHIEEDHFVKIFFSPPYPLLDTSL